MILNVLIIHGIKVSSFDAVSAIKEINHSMQINIFKESDNTKVIDIIKNKDIHIIILDSDSNDLFHLNIVELLQNNIRTKNIHIMFLLDTFKAEDFLDNGYAIEEIDYLIKPIQKYQFLNKLHLYLKLLMCKRELDEYKKVIDYATIVSKTDTKGKITYVNDKFCKISGYEREELIGKPHNLVRSPNMPKEAFADLWKTVQSNQNWEGIVENRAKNGSSYFVKAIVMPILDFKNEIVEYISIREDITELKMLQLDELSSSIDKALDINWRNSIESIPIASVIIDKDSKIKFSNTLFNEIIPFNNESNLSDFFIEKDGYIYEDIIFDWKDILLNTISKEKVLINKNHQEIEFNIVINKIKNQNLYIVCFNNIENIL